MPAEFIDVTGWFSYEAPVEFPLWYRWLNRNQFNVETNWDQLVVAYVATPEPVSADALRNMLTEDEYVSVLSDGEADGEYWAAGYITEDTAVYRHFFYGEKGYVSIQASYKGFDPESLARAESSVRTVLESIRIAPLN